MLVVSEPQWSTLVFHTSMSATCAHYCNYYPSQFVFIRNEFKA
jgi:hypothetical protein